MIVGAQPPAGNGPARWANPGFRGRKRRMDYSKWGWSALSRTRILGIPGVRLAIAARLGGDGEFWLLGACCIRRRGIGFAH